MKGAALAVLLCAAGFATLRADEPVEEYVEALRERGYIDLAVEVLETRKASAGLSAEEVGDCEFQIAALLVESARTSADLTEREAALNAAAKRFDEFGKKFPEHPRRGEALAETASIALQRGRLRILQAQLPAYSGRSAKLADEGRAMLGTASKMYADAHAAVTALRDKLPLPVEDDKTNRDLRRRRSRLFNKIAEARFQSAYAKFLLADSYRTVPAPEGGKEAADEAYNKTILEAETLFAGIADDYRQWIVGPVGRVWQARCLAARGEHRKARGLFEQILESKHKSLAAVHRQAFYFGLISLGAQADYATVLARGDEWLRANGRFKQSAEYQGVLMEMARAHVALAEAEGNEAKKTDRLAKANEYFETVGKTPNEFQGLARREQMAIEPSLANDAVAKTFQQLLSRAVTRLDALGPGAPADERKAVVANVKEMLAEAIAVAKPTDPVHQARLQLAYALFQNAEYGEAADVAEKEVRSAPRGPGAPQALSIALAARGMAFEAKAADGSLDPQKDAANFESIAKFAVETYGQAAAGDEARIALARLDAHPTRKRFAEAATGLEAVTATSTRFGEAQSELGRVYLMLASERTKPGAEATAKEFREKAFAALSKASETLHKGGENKLDRLTVTTDGLLADLLLARNRANDAWALVEPLANALERGSLPASVDSPLRLSTALAALQTAIQLGKFDATDRLIALVSRQQGQEKADDVTQAFFALASRMRDQLDRLQAQGNAEAGQRMEESYETFLDKLAARETGQNVQSLAFLGNAYIELRRYDKAQTALDKAVELARTGGMGNDAALTSIRATAALCLSGRGKHEEAVQLIETLVQTAPQAQEVLFARGKILMAAGRLKEAEAHWARIIQGTSRNRPPHYYEALGQLIETYLLHTGAPRKAALTKAKRYLTIILERAHPTLTPAWRERLQRLLDRVEDG